MNTCCATSRRNYMRILKSIFFNYIFLTISKVFFSFFFNYLSNRNILFFSYKFICIIKNKIKTKSKIIIKRNDKKFFTNNYKIFESKDLSLNSKKAFKKLKWKPFLSINKAVDLTVEWYMAFKKGKNLSSLTKKQILDYRRKFNSDSR